MLPGWRMNTNNIRNMNTNTLCVEHLKYEYTQFLLFIFTNIIRSSTPPLATITALQKAAKELSKYVPRARTFDLLIFRLPLCQFWYWLWQCCNVFVAIVDSMQSSDDDQQPTNGQCWSNSQMPIESVLDPGLVAESKGAYLRCLRSAATMQGVPKRCSPRKNSSS